MDGLTKIFRVFYMKITSINLINFKHFYKQNHFSRTYLNQPLFPCLFGSTTFPLPIWINHFYPTYLDQPLFPCLFGSTTFPLPIWINELSPDSSILFADHLLNWNTDFSWVCTVPLGVSKTQS